MPRDGSSHSHGIIDDVCLSLWFVPHDVLLQFYERFEYYCVCYRVLISCVFWVLLLVLLMLLDNSPDFSCLRFMYVWVLNPCLLCWSVCGGGASKALFKRDDAAVAVSVAAILLFVGRVTQQFFSVYFFLSLFLLQLNFSFFFIRLVWKLMMDEWIFDWTHKIGDDTSRFGAAVYSLLWCSKTFHLVKRSLFFPIFFLTSMNGFFSTISKWFSECFSSFGGFGHFCNHFQTCVNVPKWWREKWLEWF